MLQNMIFHYQELVAHDSNGFVEAVELKNKIFCLGVKWHPEIMENDEIMKNIFKEFINSCDMYHKIKTKKI